MPTGVYQGRHGKKPSCVCGNCHKCKKRKWDADYRRLSKVSDEGLERRMAAHKEPSWKTS